MDYPDNYNTTAFTAGKKIAISRAMAIGIFVMFFVSIYLCVIIIWSIASKKVSPYLISTNPETGVWSVVGKEQDQNIQTVYQTVQESLIANTVKDWFTIGSNTDDNNVAWQKCDVSYCSNDENILFGSRKCSISCSVSDDVYMKFADKVIPDYEDRQSKKEMWTLNENNLEIVRTSQITAGGGNWVARGTVVSNSGEEFYIRVFITVNRSPINYPQTMGFYISDFNAYRMEQ